MLHCSSSLVRSHERAKANDLSTVHSLQALEIITRLLHVGEVVEVKTDPKFAYGKLGRAPDIPPNSQIHYVIALLEIKPPLEYEKMPPLVS